MMHADEERDRSRARFAVRLFNDAAYGYDLIAEILSYGQYHRWQNALINAAADHGINSSSSVLDVATGTAGIALDLARRHQCTVVGLDQSPGMLGAARRKLINETPQIFQRIALVEGSAVELPFPNASFDGITFSYLFRYVDDPAGVLRECVRVARPGAFVGFIEFHLPSSFPRVLWQFHTRLILPVAGRLVSRGWYEIGKFLGPSIEGFYQAWDLESLRLLLQECGLEAVDYRVMSLGGGLVMWGRKKPEA